MDQIQRKKTLELFYRKPHLLGHLAGKKKLKEIHGKWIRYFWTAGPSQHRSIQAHRGSYKTTSIIEIGTVWSLLFHPDQKIGIGRKTFSEASDTIKTISQILILPQPGSAELCGRRWAKACARVPAQRHHLSFYRA